MIKCALADVNKVPALVLQTDNLHYSGKLLMCNAGAIVPAIAMVGDEKDKIYFLVYDTEQGIEDPLFVEEADQEAFDFVKHTKADKTWVLVMQIVMISNQGGDKSPYTVITLRNIGGVIEIEDPIVKEDWVVTL